jgi:lipopolysaccharide/colanic/teichoic acid biosynthesis glycosyltransferase
VRGLATLERAEAAGKERDPYALQTGIAACQAALRQLRRPIGYALSCHMVFRQQRVGRGGELFTMLKFRSMVPDAEARKVDLMAHNEGNGGLFKIRDDPRTTRFGRFLREFSLDELPQLFNVLAGSMSGWATPTPACRDHRRDPMDVGVRLMEVQQLCLISPNDSPLVEIH